jgi:RimJ/RimL family protein N-acetyltransferase
MDTPRAVVISNDYVTLKPLSREEAASYLEIGKDAEIWDYLAPAPFETLADAQRWIASMLHRAADAGDVTFSVYDNASGGLAGSSSYLDVRVGHGGLEIGFTWYAKAFQRTHVNTATKLALFEHAFEKLGANRVQLQTDARNLASQKAIERIGAVKEGTLRKHKIYPDGYVRDSVMYSVTLDEWPRIKDQLGRFLAGK